MSTNYNKLPALIKHGSVSIQESLNDYPKLTITEYSPAGTTRPIGEILNYGDLTYVLDSIGIEKCPIELPNLRDKLTYSYVHISSKVLDFPIPTKEFVDKHSPVKRTKSSNFYSIGSLVSFAKSKGRLGNVSPPGFIFELGISPSPDETITLRDIIDEKLEVLRLVYNFYQDTVSFTKLGSKGILLPNIVKNYTIGYGTTNSYRDSGLSWKERNDNESNSVDKKTYRKIKDTQYLQYEGDYNPHIAPPETADGDKFPRDLSIMFDNSGVTKTCKITKYIWNKPAVEIEATWGFAHAAVELVEDPNKPNIQSDRVIALMSENVAQSGNAYQEVLASIKSGKYGYPDDANFNKDIIWRLISIKEKEYIYEPLQLTISPKLKKPDGTYESVTIAEGLSNFVQSSAQVLVREITKGWELKRFAQEDSMNWTQGSINGWIELSTLVALKATLQNSSILAKQQYYWMLYYAKLKVEQYLYRKIPLWEQVDYSIAPYSQYYKDAEKIDWQVQYIPRNQLKEYKGTDDDTPVAIVYPDPNWEPQLMLLGQSRLKMSIGLSGNPEYDPYKRNYFGTNPLTVTTGSEEYELIVHTVQPSKNTKSSRSLNPIDAQSALSHVSISEVISAMENDIEYNGTFYQDKPYTNIPDYGIESVPVPTVIPGKVRAQGISSLDERDDQYTTLTSIRTAQDHSFKNHLTTTTFTLADGRPPSAVTRKPMFEEVQEDSKTNPYPGTKTLITSSNYTSYTPVTSSVSVGAAENLSEALVGAGFKLTMEILNGSSTSVTLHFESGVPTSFINKTIMIPGTNSTWVVKGCTQSIQFTEDIAFPQPIELDCGIVITPGIASRTVQLKDENANGKDSVQVEVTANLPKRYGTPITEIPVGFGRWLNTN